MLGVVVSHFELILLLRKFPGTPCLASQLLLWKISTLLISLALHAVKWTSSLLWLLSPILIPPCPVPWPAILLPHCWVSLFCRSVLECSCLAFPLLFFMSCDVLLQLLQLLLLPVLLFYCRVSVCFSRVVVLLQGFCVFLKNNSRENYCSVSCAIWRNECSDWETIGGKIAKKKHCPNGLCLESCSRLPPSDAALLDSAGQLNGHFFGPPRGFKLSRDTTTCTKYKTFRQMILGLFLGV